MCKNSWKTKKCQIFEKKYFHEFSKYDYMVWFGWKYIPWKCFKEDIIFTESILPKSPIILSTSSEKGVFEGLFQFQAKFSHSWSTKLVLTKILTWQKSPELILQNPNFDFFISILVLDKFIFLGSLTYNPDFEITIFICFFQEQDYELQFFKLQK